MSFTASILDIPLLPWGGSCELRACRTHQAMKKSYLILCFFAFGIALLGALATGRYPIGLYDLFHLALSGLGFGGQVPPEMLTVFWNIRVPGFC